MANTKKTWTSPELIALVREGSREEFILSTCKNSIVGSSSEDSDMVCYNTVCEGCNATEVS